MTISPNGIKDWYTLTATGGQQIPKVRSKTVLDFAEIIDCKDVQDQQVILFNVVDLVLRVSRNKQHPNGINCMNYTIDGDRSASRQGEIGFRL